MTADPNSSELLHPDLNCYEPVYNKVMKLMELCAYNDWLSQHVDDDRIARHFSVLFIANDQACTQIYPLN